MTKQLWDLIAADILMHANGSDIKLKGNKVCEEQELDLYCTQRVQQALRRQLKNVDIQLIISFKSEEMNEDYERSLYIVDKQEEETWAVCLRRRNARLTAGRPV